MEKVLGRKVDTIDLIAAVAILAAAVLLIATAVPYYANLSGLVKGQYEAARAGKATADTAASPAAAHTTGHTASATAPAAAVGSESVPAAAPKAAAAAGGGTVRCALPLPPTLMIADSFYVLCD
jgi:hypothetical protein